MNLVIVVTIVVGLLVDQNWPIYGQPLVSLAAWLVLAALWARAEPRVRPALVACLAFATAGEVFLSLVWRLYEYREGFLPLFVPPGHVLLFFLGTQVAARLPDRGAWWIALAALPAVALFAASGRDTLGPFLYLLLLLCMYLSPARKLYATMFVLALSMELYGTWMGNWAWSPRVPWLGLTAGNPPLTAGVFYCVLDLLVVTVAARWFRGTVVAPPTEGRSTMPRQRLSCLLLAVLLGDCWLPGPLAGDAPAVLEAERPDDPPGATAARANALARSPGLRVGFGPYESVQVNVDAQGQNIVGDAANEPSLAVNAQDPANLVIGWRQFDTIGSNFRQAGWGYTFDGGASWTFPGVLTPGIFRSDPVLASDSQGTFYYQSLTGDFFVDVFRSTDGGVTWLAPVTEYGGDKNWMTVDRSGGASDGHLYGIWQRFAGCCGANVLTRSTNDGASFEPPVPVAFSPTFGTLAVGPSAELYATGIDGTTTQDFTHFVVAKSMNASNPAVTPTFAGARVALGGNMRISAGPNPGGLLGQGNVAVDSSSEPTRGNVYVVASVDPVGADPLDVHFIRSANGGATWSPPKRINDDPSAGNWQWLAAHSVAPNGRIDVIWNDTRNSGVANVSQLFYAYSWNAGATWSVNVPVSPPFDSTVGFPQQNKIGDYSAIVADASGADVAYAATFNGEQDVYHVRVFPDCNENGVSDVIDIASGPSADCDASHVPDECQTDPACLGAGAVPDGAQATPLSVAKDAAGDLDLEWSVSCRDGDADYAIYEGALGDFASHTARFCSTGGETTKHLTPASADSYYLVVPTRADREGSYGSDSAGIERPQGLSACFPQLARPCDVGF